MRFQILIAAALGAVAMPAMAQTAPAPVASPTAAAAGQPRHYTAADTDMGTLLDDPAAKAVLAKHFPEMIKGDQIEQARSMTLKEIQPYASDTLTDAALTSVDADFARLPPKK